MINPTKTLLSVSLASVIALTAGCASDMSGAGRGAANDRIDSVEAQIGADGSVLSRVQDTGRPSNVRVRDGIYLGKDGFRTGRGDPLPRRLEGPDGVSLKLGDQVSLTDLAPYLQRATGLKVDLRDLDTLSGMASSGGGSGSGGSQSDSAGADESVSGDGPSGGSTFRMADAKFKVDYQGSLSGFLDYVAHQVGADWEYVGGRVKFVGPQTTTYTIWALPGNVSAEGSVGGGGGDTFGSGTPPSTSYSISYDYWEDIQSGLNAIVPERGAKFAINRSSGTVTVTGFQAVHERVQEFIQEENGRLSRQVAVKIDVLAFAANDSDSRRGNINAVLKDVSAGMNAGLDFNIINGGEPITGTPSFGMTVLDWDDSPLRKMEGSSSVISALASKGKVSLLKSTSVVATNNQPTPVSLATEKGYLRSVTQEQGEEGESTTVIDTGILSNGLNMTFTPRVMSNGEVMLSYHMALSEIVGLEQFTSGGNMVQMPEVENRTFMQTVTIDSGDSMVVAAHDSSSSERSAFGPFNPGFWGLGGQDGYSMANTKIVILMTPVVLEKANTPSVRR